MKHAVDILIPTKTGSFRITQEQYGTGFIIVKLYETLLGCEFISLNLSVPFSSLDSCIDGFKKLAYTLADRRPIEL